MRIDVKPHHMGNFSHQCSLHFDSLSQPSLPLPPPNQSTSSAFNSYLTRKPPTIGSIAFLHASSGTSRESDVLVQTRVSRRRCARFCQARIGMCCYKGIKLERRRAPTGWRQGAGRDQGEVTEGVPKSSRAHLLWDRMQRARPKSREVEPEMERRK